MITLGELFALPQLPQWHQAIGARLQAERVRRARFYEEIRPGQKAEFINGQVVLHPPARGQHVLTSSRLVTLLSAHVRARRLGVVGAEKLLVALARNDYEPDVVFYGREKAAALTADQLLFPAPDLAVEILSPGTQHRDRGIKLEDYAVSGVGEYWIVDVDSRQVEQYVLDAGAESYRLAGRVDDGQELRGIVVTGFVVPVRAFFDDEANDAALRRLLSA